MIISLYVQLAVIYCQALDERRDALEVGQDNFLRSLREVQERAESDGSGGSRGRRSRTVSEASGVSGAKQPSPKESDRPGRKRNHSEPNKPKALAVVPPGQIARKQATPKRFHSSSPGGVRGRSKLARKYPRVARKPNVEVRTVNGEERLIIAAL